ncbi:MAG: nuclease-related domain-containing protein [Chloroflexota bacterium]|nr:nuclease-related domain-containing protein [Anaerolineales bacterium]
MLIDLFVSDLIAGYKELKTAREALIQKWRFELLRAYTRQREHYTAQLARQEGRKERYQRALPFIGAALFLVCAVGSWLTFRSVELACLGMFLMLGSGVGALLTLVPSTLFARTPLPPENPVTRTSNDEDESPLRQRLFPKLLPLWREEMRLRIPSEEEAEQIAAETGKWGLIGEFELVRALERIISSDTYILHGMQPKPGDDLDVAVIGPKGFWYFEVKHWNAQFVWQAGVWQIWQFDYETQAPRPVELKETPDAQWTRMREEVLAHLKASAPNLLKKFPVLGNIHGGIVFSNPHATTEIDRSAPFRYGTVEQWVAVYQAAPRLKDMSPGRTLQLLELLLKRHQSFHPDVQPRSMKAALGKVIAEVEAGIQQWIDNA